MKESLLLFLLTFTVAGQSGSCPDCPDPTRPWMRGQVEIACSYDGHPIEGDTVAEWRACQCQHLCDPADERAGETDGRKWDSTCSARCRTDHCHCPHPCDEDS